MKNGKLSDLQIALLPMLDWFHNFCVKNHLRYYAIGGTMLGVARHQGFIPWDDDIDIGMPRNDYEKFMGLCGDKQFDCYYVESINTEKTDFYYGYGKIYDTRTTLVENTRYKIKRGIYLDIFPLDGAGNSKEEAEKIYKPIKKKIDLLGAKSFAIRKQRKLYKNIAIFMGRLIPEWIVNSKQLMIDIDNECKKYDYDESAFMANFMGNWGMREILPVRVMGTPRLYSFEGIEVFGVEKPDEYLSMVYGDWRKLPPVEKQVTHHDYLYLDLNSGYTCDDSQV